MKLIFDNNLSPNIVTAIRALEPMNSGWALSSLREEYEHNTPDPDWMYAFAKAGGVAMISGDHQILQKPENLVAYIDSGLVSIWPPPEWPKLKRYGQAALLIRWWPTIIDKIAASSPGDKWRFPMQWTPGIGAFKALRDPRIEQ